VGFARQGEIRLAQVKNMEDVGDMSRSMRGLEDRRVAGTDYPATVLDVSEIGFRPIRQRGSSEFLVAFRFSL
jgi:hypothetical protein